MNKTVLLVLVVYVALVLTGCESLFTSGTYPKTGENASSASSASLSSAISSAAAGTESVESTDSSQTEGAEDVTYHFKDGENEYFLDWAYTDDDKVFSIDKNSGIFIASLTGDDTMNRLFETSLKKELQALGYNNIVLGTYSSGFDMDSTDYGIYALEQGCYYIISFYVEDSWVYENGGGLSDSTCYLVLCDVASAFSNTDGIFDTVIYGFIVSAQNHFQSYNSSLVTFNGFMAKQVMQTISAHLTGEDGPEDNQTFFESGQSGKIKEYFDAVGISDTYGDNE